MLVVLSLSVCVWADNGFLVKTQSDTEIKHKADHLIVVREGSGKPICYQGKGGIFPSTVKLNSGDFIGCVEDSTFTTYDDLDSIMYIKDGMMFFRLPDCYKAPVQTPAGPLLSLVNSSAGSMTTVAPATGFLCIQYNDTLSQIYNKITVTSDSVPIAGDMLYDGFQLIPLPGQSTEVTVDLKHSRKFVVPVPADVDLNLELVARHTNSGRNKKFSVKDNIARGEINCHYIYGVDSIHEDTTKKAPIPGRKPLVNEVDDKDNHKKDKAEKPRCPSYIPISIEQLLNGLYDDLKERRKLDTNNFINWGSNLPLYRWKNVTYSPDGYTVCIEPDKLRAIGYGIVLAAVNDIGLTEKSEKGIRKLTESNRPECEVHPWLGSVMRIEKCDSIKSLKLRSLKYEKLVIASCANLESLDVIDCSFEQIEITCCPSLNTINAPLNRIENLAIKNCPDISFLNVSCNRLKELNLRNLPELSRLNCSLNYLETLDLSKNPQLEILICAYNKLSDLNLEAQTNLEKLSCLGNGLLRIKPSIFQLVKKGLKMYNTEGKIVEEK